MVLLSCLRIVQTVRDDLKMMKLSFPHCTPLNCHYKTCTWQSLWLLEILCVVRQLMWLLGILCVVRHKTSVALGDSVCCFTLDLCDYLGFCVLLDSRLLWLLEILCVVRHKTSVALGDSVCC